VRFAALLTAALVTALIAVCLPATAAARAPIAWGTFTPGAPESRQTIEDFNSMLGRRAVIWHTYKNFDEDPFPYVTVGTAWDSGAVPLLTWEPWGKDLRAMARGEYDDYLHSAARSGASFGRPVLLLPGHEMNATWYPWGVGTNGNTSGDYKRAYRHIVRIFRQEHASNIKFVWAPNVGKFDSMYPGDDYVDFVALDGYNWGAKYGNWESFSDVFDSSYRDIVRLSHRPLFINEFGANELGGDKAAWIRDAFSHRVLDRYPRIRGLVWFDLNKEVDWRVNSSGGTLDAFRSMIQHSLFNLDAESFVRLADRRASTPPPADPPPVGDASHKMHCGVRARTTLWVSDSWDVNVPLRCDRAANHWCSGWVKIREANSRRKLGVADVDLWPGRRRSVRIGVPGWARTSLAPRRHLAVRIRMHADSGCATEPVRHVTLNR
jgi:Glycosyl hydrolase family 26